MLRTPISKDELNRFPLKNSSTVISELGPSACYKQALVGLQGVWRGGGGLVVEEPVGQVSAQLLSV